MTLKKVFKIILWFVGSLIGLIALFLLLVWIFSGNRPEGGTTIAKKSDRKSEELSKDTLFGVKYGVGIKHKDCSMFDIAVDLLYYRGYTFMDKIHYLQRTIFSLSHMFHKVIKDNLFETSIRFEVPVYIIQGKHDYQVSYQLAKAYLDSIEAPQKEFYTFEESAHSPNLEEPKRFIEIIKSTSER